MTVDASSSPSRMAGTDSQDPPLSSGTRRAARIGWWALGAGLGAFLIWAALAPLDEGVPMPGQVSLDTKRKPVQHLAGGIVRQVMVQEGAHVDAGQALMTLVETTARANHEAVRQRYLGLRAVQGRLLAEQAGQTAIDLHPDLIAAADDPSAQAQISTQRQLLASRRLSLRADLQAIEENIRGQEALLQSHAAMSAQRRSQQVSLTEQLDAMRGLVTEGYVPRNRQRELERQVADAEAALAEITGNSARVRRTMAELAQRAVVRQQAYREEVDTQLADVTREVQGDVQRLVALQAELDRMAIRAPATGQVVGLVVQTVGAVVQPGQTLMDIVPDGQPLLLEAHVAPHLIDKVRVGLPADIRFQSFSQAQQPVVEGRVESVSGDLLTDPQNPQRTYYLARLSVTPAGLKALGERRLQPGMPADIVVRTGERTLLTYLLNPLTRRVAASMKEE